MPFVDSDGTKIYFDEEGNGDPLLLIMGLGCTSGFWHRTRPALAERFRTIALDNRGIGRSEAPPGPYTTAMMASDAAAVLDAANVEQAHVIGCSMGGMIAQELVLAHPARVRSLILGCTSPGGPHAIPPARPALANLTPAEAEEALLAMTYHEGTPRALIDEDSAVRGLPEPAAYAAQVAASQGFDAYDRLPQVTARTLVVHGENDRRVPMENGRLLAARIPGAKLVLIPNAGHVFTTDQADTANRIFLTFLAMS